MAMFFPPGAPLRRGGVFAQAAGPGGGVVDAGETWGPGRSLRSLHPTYLLLSCYAKMAGAEGIIYTIYTPFKLGTRLGICKWVGAARGVRASALMQVVAEDNDSKHTRSGLTSHV